MKHATLRLGAAAAFAAASALACVPSNGAGLNYGKPGEPVHLTVGYQPYNPEAWSGVVINGLQLWKKYLPLGSTVEFQAGLQDEIVIGALLAGKQSIGYAGAMPAIAGAAKRSVADLRIVAATGLGYDQCNVLLVKNEAPQFKGQQAAVLWLNGKRVAVTKGGCTDRFARSVFKQEHIAPGKYLDQSIEAITSGFRAGKLDAAVVWEPAASRLAALGLARRVASGTLTGGRDGAFIDIRADLISQRPDVVKAWLKAELDAEIFLADPKNQETVIRLVKERTIGFTEKDLWSALYHAYPASAGGVPVRLTSPFAFTGETMDLIKAGTAFLYLVKRIDVPRLPDGAVVVSFTGEILEERSLRPPVAVVTATPDGLAH